MIKILSSFALTFMLIGCASTQKNKTQIIEGHTHHDKKVVVDFKKNKNTVVVFLSAYCPCSNSHVEILKTLSKKYPQVKFVGVHSNYTERKKNALKYFDKVEMNFPVIHDAESEIAKKLGAVKTPHAFIINEEGETIYNGSVTDSSNGLAAKENFLDLALLDISQGKAPREAKKKTLGCYIPLKKD